MIGTLFGSPFPSATYIGHPGWKDIGGRIGYSLVTGVVVGTITLLGAMSVVVEVIPLIAVLPILMYIGAVMGAQAFTSIPDRHSPAVVVALLPNILEYLNSQIDTALSAAGTTATEVGYGALAGAGVYYEGMMIASDEVTHRRPGFGDLRWVHRIELAQLFEIGTKAIGRFFFAFHLSLPPGRIHIPYPMLGHQEARDIYVDPTTGIRHRNDAPTIESDSAFERCSRLPF